MNNPIDSQREVFTLGLDAELLRLAELDSGYAVYHRKEFVSVMNSYLGMMRHFAARNLVRRICGMISTDWFEIMNIYVTGGRYKAVMRKEYRSETMAIVKLEEELERMNTDSCLEKNTKPP